MTPNVQALQELCDLLEGKHSKYSLPEHYIFDMGNWMLKDKSKKLLIERYGKKKTNGCHTAGCAIGYAITCLPKFKKMYRLKEVVSGEFVLEFKYADRFELWTNSWENIGTPLGISEHEFWYLFGAGQYYALDCVFTKLDYISKDYINEKPIYGAGARKEIARRIKKLLKEFAAREMETENAA